MPWSVCFPISTCPLVAAYADLGTVASGAQNRLLALLAPMHKDVIDKP